MSLSHESTEHKGRNKDGSGRAVTRHEDPYLIEAEIVGDEDILFHRYDAQVVADKAAAAKGSKTKKEDNIDSYVYRDDKNRLVMPGENIKASICNAAKSTQDPRSTGRKGAKDLMRAGIKIKGSYPFQVENEERQTWEFVDARRVVVQQSAVTRRRPGLRSGWRLKFQISVILPEYISEELLNEILVRAGKTCGIGDFRPDFGTFRVTSFQRLKLVDLDFAATCVVANELARVLRCREAPVRYGSVW